MCKKLTKERLPHQTLLRNLYQRFRKDNLLTQQKNWSNLTTDSSKKLPMGRGRGRGQNHENLLTSQMDGSELICTLLYVPHLGSSTPLWHDLSMFSPARYTNSSGQAQRGKIIKKSHLNPYHVAKFLHPSLKYSISVQAALISHLIS